MEQDAEAAQFLKEASQSVKKNAYFMRKAMVSCVTDVSRCCAAGTVNDPTVGACSLHQEAHNWVPGTCKQHHS